MLDSVTNGACNFFASAGRIADKDIPNKSGSARIILVWIRKLVGLKSTCVSRLAVGGYCEHQNIIEIGVMKAAATLEVAVSETESAVLPCASSTNKLETLPPGQHAIRIMPSATVGDGFNR